MRELVAEKLPHLDSHLHTYGVDIAVITFNWLLAAFVDALPTEVSHILFLHSYTLAVLHILPTLTDRGLCFE